jgi:hypothetical protein
MRAFIFSLDAFVAFTLALIAIYSLIFFSSIPSSYYYLLTQGHYLSRDVLMALSTTSCVASVYPCPSGEGISVLDNIASTADIDQRQELVRETVGKMIPGQFGYTIESVDSQGKTIAIYDTATADGDPHAKERKKLSISSQVMTFGYSSAYAKPSASIYNYLSCNADGFGLGGLVTCGLGGNTNPSSGGKDLVPSANVKIVKLTIFI